MLEGIINQDVLPSEQHDSFGERLSHDALRPMRRCRIGTLARDGSAEAHNARARRLATVAAVVVAVTVREVENRICFRWSGRRPTYLAVGSSERDPAVSKTRRR